MKGRDLRELQQDYSSVTLEKISKGSLIETVLGEDDGLILKNGRSFRSKKLIVVGVDKEQVLCFGSILINTKINPNAGFSDEFLSAQYLLKQKEYPQFLKYDSYVDCAQVLPISATKLLRGKYYGRLSDNDLIGIFNILETTDTLTTKQKKRFGIKRR